MRGLGKASSAGTPTETALTEGAIIDCRLRSVDTPVWVVFLCLCLLVARAHVGRSHRVFSVVGCCNRGFARTRFRLLGPAIWKIMPPCCLADGHNQSSIFFASMIVLPDDGSRFVAQPAGTSVAANGDCKPAGDTHEASLVMLSYDNITCHY